MHIEQAAIADFLEHSQDHLWTIETDLLELENGNFDILNELLRAVSSIHANAEMLSIDVIQDPAYQLEKSLKLIRNHRLSVDKECVTLLLKVYDILVDSLTKMQAPYGLSAVDAKTISLHSKPIFQTLDSHLALLRHPIQFFSEIETIFPLRTAIALAAADCGKQVEFTLQGGDVPIQEQILKRLPRLLTHLINNAIAHGIESPEVRQSQGKPTVGQITISATLQDGRAVITFADDGAGIDGERVKAKAIAKGLIDPQSAHLLTEDAVYAFLFHPNFSTRDVRDMRAGTGYGLDIVQTELKKIGGTIQVRSTPQHGTTFTMTYPIAP